MGGTARGDVVAGPSSRDRLVGQPVLRTEDARFVTGTGCFVDDFTREGMCHAVVVRSPVAHARLTGIRRATALQRPGVLTVLTASDLGDLGGPIPIRIAPLPGFDRYLQAPLARDRVRYVGEPVAVVIAEDRGAADDAAELVTAEYELLDPVVDVHQAMTDESVLHESAGTNVASRYTVSRGSPDAAFAGAEYTRKETFRCHRHGAMPLETRGLVAEWDAVAARMTVWGATKVTFFNRATLAQMLGLAQADVELVELDVGGSFGVRGEFYPEDFLIPFAATRVGRPVKWIEDRREHLMTANHSREIECELTIAAQRDGTILGLQARLYADMGAYVRTNGGVVPAKAAQFLPGPYRIANFGCEVSALVTSKTPTGTYRGPGRFEANFFRERLIDLMAADLALDPAEVRLRNLLTPAEMPYGIGKLVPYEAAGEYDTGDYASALRRALQAIDYPRLAALSGSLVGGRRQGVGIGCFVESSGAGPAETARIAVRRPGRVDLHTGCASSGQGIETWMAQILADALGIPFEWIRVLHGTTSFVDEGHGTYHSRAVVVGGSAVKVAAETLVEQVRALAARRAGVDPAELLWQDGEVHRRGRIGEGPVLTLAELADEGSAEAEAALEAVGRFRPDKLTYTYGAHVAHVAVDLETGQVEVVRLVAVEDVGRAINPLLVHGQAIGAAVQGLGGAFLERLVYDEAGQLMTGTLADYALPTAEAFPSIDAITLEEAPSRLNPLGAKGAGEGGIVAIGAAAANAVAAALAPLGVVIRDLPLSPPALVALLHGARGSPTSIVPVGRAAGPRPATLSPVSRRIAATAALRPERRCPPGALGRRTMDDPRYSTYSAITDRPRLRWPGNARVALWVAPNVEFYEYEPPPSTFRNAWSRMPHPDVLHYSYRDYGNRVGFWRMLEVFDHHRVRASVSLNMAVLEHFPEIRDAMVARNWDYITHGIYNTRYLFGLTPDEERAFYQDNIDTLYRHTGKQLHGMLGPAFSSTASTPELMAEAGLTYQVDWFHDDQPFPINVESGRLISLPYTRELNDSVLFNGPGLEADYFAQICKDQFDVLYEEGAETGQVMCIALHPFLIGQPHRVRYLDDIFRYVLARDGVWVTTSDEIAEYYMAHHYEPMVAHLARPRTTSV